MTPSARIQWLRDASKTVSRTVDRLRASLATLIAERRKLDPSKLSPSFLGVERTRLLTEAKQRAQAIMLDDDPLKLIATAEDVGAVFADPLKFVALARFTRPAPTPDAHALPPERAAYDTREALEATMHATQILLAQRASVPQLEADAADAIASTNLAKVGVIVRELDFRAGNGTDAARHALSALAATLRDASKRWPEMAEGAAYLDDLREARSYVDTLTGKSLEDAVDYSRRWQDARELSLRGITAATYDASTGRLVPTDRAH